MSPKERKKLCAELRNADLPDQPMCDEAADELERLAEELRITNKALSMCSDECNKLYEKYDKKLDIIEEHNKLAQSDAEPVAWRYRVKSSSSWFVALRNDASYWRASNYEVEPLYTAPPRATDRSGK